MTGRVIDDAGAGEARRWPQPRWPGVGDADIMALAFLVMMQASRDARADLASIMQAVKAANGEKTARRAAVAVTHLLARAITPAALDATPSACVTITAELSRWTRYLADDDRGGRDPDDD